MTVRSRRSTQEGTGVNDPARRRALLGTPPRGGAAVSAPGAATQGESWELVTEVTPRPVPVEQATPTRIDTPLPGPPPGPPAGHEPGSPGPDRPAREMSLESALVTPTTLAARPERSEPIRVISMKEQADAAPARNPVEPRVPLHVQLRTMAEVAGMHEPPSGLGRLAPPHDPLQARKRRRRDNLVWACVAFGLAGGISLAIWLIAGR